MVTKMEKSHEDKGKWVIETMKNNVMETMKENCIGNKDTREATKRKKSHLSWCN